MEDLEEKIAYFLSRAVNCSTWIRLDVVFLRVRNSGQLELLFLYSKLH